MKLLDLSFLKLKNNLPQVVLICLSFLVFIFLNRGSLFQPFDSDIVDNYLRSQDIFDKEDKIKDRIFISDNDIYIATGYLYAQGADPREFNFQHPPLVKYLFGWGARYFSLPLLMNVFFGLILLLEIYLLGNLVFKNRWIGVLGSVLLVVDPVFKEVTSYALLDLGQAVFILGFVIVSLFYSNLFVLEGILLGLAAASKFWTPVLFFFLAIYLYKFVFKKERFFIKKEAVKFFVAFFPFDFIN